MRYKITWLNSNTIQYFTLVSHKCQFKNNYGYFTIYSPIYEAIENNTFYLDLGYGKHLFKIEEL